jgi:hypothetical protein
MFKFLKKLGTAYIMFGLGTIFGSTVAALTAAIIYGPADSDLLDKVLDKCGPKTVLIVPDRQPTSLFETSEPERVALSYTHS